MDALGIQGISGQLEAWVIGLVVAAVDVGLAVLTHRVLFAVLRRLTAETKSSVDSAVDLRAAATSRSKGFAPLTCRARRWGSSGRVASDGMSPASRLDSG